METASRAWRKGRECPRPGSKHRAFGDRQPFLPRGLRFPVSHVLLTPHHHGNHMAV